MPRNIEYFFTPVSPFTYLGHDRFVAIAGRHGVSIDVKPVDLGPVFPASGGLPLKQRAPQRQAYRLVELATLVEASGLPLNLQPRHFPVPPALASKWILAAQSQQGAERRAQADRRAVARGLGRGARTSRNATRWPRSHPSRDSTPSRWPNAPLQPTSARATTR